MLKLRHLAIGALLAGIAVAVFIAWQVGLGDVVRLLQAANKHYLVAYLVISVLIAFFLTLKWAVVLDAQGHSVPLHRLFAYRLVGYSVNYLTPTMHVGSEPIRAYLLKREGIPTDDAVSNVIIDKSVELATNAVFFFFGALLLLQSVLVSGGMKIAMLCASLVGMLLLGMFIMGVLGKESMFVKVFRTLRLNRIQRLRGFEESLARIEKGVEEFYRNRKRHFLLIIAIMAFLWVLMYLEYSSILLFLGHQASVLQIFLILTGVGIAYSIPVPAAIGTLELGQISAAKVLDLGSVTGVTLAFVIRARDLLWTVLGLIAMGAYQFSFRRLARTSESMDSQFERGTLLRKG
jgi:uncharacterized protein (TIRG00374 family)